MPVDTTECLHHAVRSPHLLAEQSQLDLVTCMFEVSIQTVGDTNFPSPYCQGNTSESTFTGSHVITKETNAPVKDLDHSPGQRPSA